MDRSNDKDLRSKNQRGKSVSTNEATDSVVLGYPDMPPTPHRFGSVPATTGAKVTSPSHSSPSVHTATGPAQAPLPKRPKGRLFIGGLLVLLVGYTAAYFYDSYIRYAAYGEVIGRRIALAAPWEGVVSTIHVREGDIVRQGDPIFQVDSLEMRHRMEQIEDTLNLERARLASDLAKLKWDAERVEDSQELVKADYYEKWSELLWEQSVLADLNQKLGRAEKLRAQDAVADEVYDSIRLQVAGQQSRAQQLSESVSNLKRRLETDRPLDPALADQIKPSIVRIENLQSELRRVRKVLDQGLVTSPANGQVTRIAKFAGEYSDATSPVIELFVDGSTEIVLYLPQSRSGDWSIGDHLNVSIESSNRTLDCEVLRVAMDMQRAPNSIERYYDAGEALLPVVVRPVDTVARKSLILGSKVRLPRESKPWRLHELTAWLRGPSNIDDVIETTTEQYPHVKPKPRRFAFAPSIELMSLWDSRADEPSCAIVESKSSLSAPSFREHSSRDEAVLATESLPSTKIVQVSSAVKPTATAPIEICSAKQANESRQTSRSDRAAEAWTPTLSESREKSRSERAAEALTPTLSESREKSRSERATKAWTPPRDETWQETPVKHAPAELVPVFHDETRPESASTTELKSNVADETQPLAITSAGPQKDPARAQSRRLRFQAAKRPSEVNTSIGASEQAQTHWPSAHSGMLVGLDVELGGDLLSPIVDGIVAASRGDPLRPKPPDLNSLI